MALLDIRELTVHFHTDEGVIHAVDSLTLSIEKGKTTCIVGESGCGKSVTARAIMRLLPVPPARIISGEILFQSKDILKLSEKEIKKIRGNNIAMIFQDPMTSLNPVLTCGYQITESLKTHRNIGRTEARETTISLLQQVGIPEPHKRIKEYPHQLSGGMRQRVMIAMALSCNPVLLIADEPTTALDVTIQAQILQIMSKLKQSHDMAVIFITHDLGVVSEIADMIIVLYAGKVVERGSKKDIIENAQHPYSIGLLESVPNMENEQEKLNVIPGTIPDPTSYTEGCRFYNRCNRHTEECKKQPSEFAVGPGHSVACFNYMKKP